MLGLSPLHVLPVDIARLPVDLARLPVDLARLPVDLARLACLEGWSGVNVQMLRKTPCVKHVPTLRSLGPMDGSEDGAGIEALETHRACPYVAPIQHDLRIAHQRG
ncbi:hypothetical protein TNIN_75801 [Trichonephila inaurata madagascariensis]|uniref:Uncharacterized protein n=1 Tax=Trichonephila inaurata madagascariensis TaxID=2747483 RepID=A0A8X6MIS2_9ARAC|nr:hypothetical protein TNIN_75801 [Trichonephila inaurata madagascariensis]